MTLRPNLTTSPAIWLARNATEIRGLHMAGFHIQALDEAKKGNWDKAHEMVQDFNDAYSCLIHGFLHRQEGDQFNARYWYTKAGHSMPKNSLDDEFSRLYEMIVEHN